MTEREYWRIKQALYMQNPRVRGRVNAQKQQRWAEHAERVNQRRRERYASDPDYRAMRLGLDGR